MQELRKISKKILTVTVIVLSAAVLATAMVDVIAQPEAEVRVVNPDTGDNNFIFSLSDIYVGLRFNITAWVYNVTDLFAHQVYLTVDDTLLNITGAWLPTWDPDYVFYGQTSIRPAPALYDTDNNDANEAVKVGDCLLMGTSFNGSGLLAVIELEIISVPSAPLITILNITYPEDTYLLDSNNDEISISRVNGVCSFEDLTPPVIDTPTQVPSENVQPNQEVKVMVNVTDDFSGVKNVTLFYTNDTEWFSVPMVYNETSGLWEGTIPGFSIGTYVKYKIEAFDNADNKAVNDNAGEYFVYTIVPELTLVMIFALLTISSMIMAIIRRKRKIRL